MFWDWGGGGGGGVDVESVAGLQDVSVGGKAVLVLLLLLLFLVGLTSVLGFTSCVSSRGAEMSSPEIEGPAFFSVREGMSCMVSMVLGISLVLIDRSAMRPARV